MIHLRPRLHRRRWVVIERIGHVITQQCRCGTTRIRFTREEPDMTSTDDQCADCGTHTTDLWAMPGGYPLDQSYWLCRPCHINRYGHAPED